MTSPLVYVAISPDLAQELALPRELTRLKAQARIEHWPGPGAPTVEAVQDALIRAQVVLTGWRTPSLQPILQEWTPEAFAVRLIAHSAGTVKQLVPMQAIERGLLVTHANDALAQAVAEFTIGIMVTARRQMIPSALRMKAGQPRVTLAHMHALAGSTVGVISASNIGRRVLRLLRSFEVTALLYDPYCSSQQANELGARLVSLHDLIARSDIVTLHAPVTSETIGMLGADEFAAMKDGALFINTARGRLIDQDALLRELQRGRIHAVLDVTDPTEPLPLDSPFFALEHCVVLPHMAAVTVETRRRQSQIIVDEILRFLNGEPLCYAVTRERWGIIA